MTHPSTEFLDLMDAVRVMGEDLRRLAEAQREVEDVAGRRLEAARTPTPA